ncbi:MAG: hypothetical protein HZC44_01285 [Geobacter sp.]|nr:hypothetical protein [Geobacter sp.]
MHKNLLTLDELQEIDLKLDGVANAREVLMAEITELDRTVTAARQELLLKQEEQAQLEDEKASLDVTLAAESENIVRSDARLKEIKTQKEYQAVSKEISMARKMKAELDEQLLQKIGQIEELKVEIAEREGNLAQLEENVSSQQSEVQGKIDALEKDVAGDRKSREEKVRSLPANIVKRYGTLRELRRGIAVVEARDGSCLGCNMNLPPQLYNTLFRGNELITCPHCQRILVLRQQTQG